MKGFIVLMASFMASVAISIDAMLPALGIMGEDLGAQNPNHSQYILVSIFAGMAVGQLVCGPLSDALGRKKVVLSGLALYAVGSIVCMFAQTLDVMIIGRLLQGLGVAGPYVCAIAIIRDKFAGRDMARIMSLVMMIFVMVPSLAPALGQGILFIASWRYIFAMLLVVAMALAAWVYWGLEETLQPKDRIKFSVRAIAAGFGEVFKNKITTGYMLCMGLIFGGFTGYLNSTRQIFQEYYDTGASFSLYFGGLALLFGTSSLLNSRLVQKFGMRFLGLRALGAILLSSTIFLGVCQFIAPQIWMFLMYASVLYFAMGLIFGNLNALAMEPMGHIAGIASAVIGATSSLISLSLGTFIGQMYDGSLMPVTTGFLALSGLCILVMWMVQNACPDDAVTA